MSPRTPIASCLAALLGLLGLMAPGPAAACDAELLALTVTKLGSSKDPELRLKKLAGSLAESCSFVPAVRDALGTVPSVPTSGRLALERKAVARDPAAWTAACAGGQAAFDEASGSTGLERAAALWGPCDVQRYKFTDQAGLVDAKGLVFLTLMVAKHFETNSVSDAQAIPLLRGLAGIEGALPGAPAGPPDPWTAARAEVDSGKGKAFDALTQAQWRAVAERALPMCESVRTRPEAERKANRQVEYDICAHAGFAADNAGSPDAPMFRPVAGNPVNWGYYLAAASARPDPTLVTRTTDETVRNAVRWYLEQLEAGAFPAP